MRRLSVAAVGFPLVCVAAVILAGCASHGVATERYAGLPSQLPVPLDDFEPSAILDDAGNLALVTYGSSSCPPTASSIDVSSSSAVTIELEFSNDGPCTADLAPTTHIIPLPPEVTGRPLTVQLKYIDDPAERTITVP